ncbi:MAG: hypothetical protein ETSY1_00640 [Candidatus Entotheonella factor]|uniref:M23ase beta-sheet core domain-containing protein n=1 Tax=Entotheonella factor TaxID=1429438 RepID=W4LZU4_ENTF1|nr:M23 family metallopeptidase [Candidatus Entotheonella palauensis]ETX03256.1 MAG: hypothetical protein ETSY1_00640 [Candidatus Entotheonella factor]
MKQFITYLVIGLGTIPLYSAPIAAHHAGRFDPQPAWPLCGHITQAEQPPHFPPVPPSWQPQDGCPSDRWGEPDVNDAPFSSTFGPRQKASENYRYDFHRGIDIPTDPNTPVFAIADGVVKKAGNDAAYSDPLVQIRHYRPGHEGKCKAGEGCYVSNYQHLAQWTVSVGEQVTKGQLIGYTGQSSSGFPHLHFEIRDAPGLHDAYSAWQRDAIHPLLVLPYPDMGAANFQLTIQALLTDPLNPEVTVSVASPNQVELDLQRVEVEVYRREGTAWQLIPQPNAQPVGITPEGTGYDQETPWFDMVEWNRQYSYKNSTKYPWSSFRPGGAYESPYAADLPVTYDPNVHLDQADPGNHQAGQFNGLTIAPAPFNTQSNTYHLTLVFHELTGDATATLCFKARALDIWDQSTAWVSHLCD